MRSRRTVLMIAFLGPCVGSIAGCSGTSGESLAASPARTNAESSATPLVPSRTTLDFGVLPQRGQQRLYFELRNPSDGPVEIDWIESDCDCVTITLTSHRLAARGGVLGCAMLDLTRAPEFVGQLATEVRVFVMDGRTALRIAVEVSVHTHADFDGLTLDLPPAGDNSLDPVPMPVPLKERAR